MVQKIRPALNNETWIKTVSAQKPLVWIFADQGKTGTLHQALGFTQTLGLKAETFLLKPKGLWGLVPRSLWLPTSVVEHGHKTLTEPWPDILISAGRSATGAAALLKKKRGQKICSIALMNPKLDPSLFDVVIPPFHDQLKGANIIPSHLAFHQIEEKILVQEGRRWKKHFHSLPLPLCGVLLGGKTRYNTFSNTFVRQLGRDLKKLSQEMGVGLCITPSRRTPKEAIVVLKEILAQTPHFIWDGQDPNPYHGILALSDYLLITGDSVQMLSEASFTANPIFIYPVPETPAKIQSFHDFLIAQKIAKPFHNTLHYWARTPFDEKEVLARKVLNLVKKSHPLTWEMLSVKKT